MGTYFSIFSAFKTAVVKKSGKPKNRISIKLVMSENETLNTEEPNTQKTNFNIKMNLPVNLNFASPVLREWMQKRREEVRPWTTFVKTNHFNVPQSPPKFTKRFYKNIEHFQSNYVFVFLILFLYCLITSPFLLVAMAASGGACWYAGHRNQDRKLILGGKEVPLAQQYAAIGVISIPLF